MTLIKDLPLSEKPREKAYHFGVETLSNAELLAIIIRTGTKDHSALSIADELLRVQNGLGGLASCDISQLMMIQGISKVKALELKAVIELQKRILQERVIHRDVVRDSADLVEWLQQQIGHSMRENFMVVFLDQANHIVSWSKLFSGTINQAVVYAREIFKEALLKGSSRIILVHNHPSHSIEPSQADIELTAKIMKIGVLMEVEVLDHIIVTDCDHLSFARAGIIQECMEAILKK